MKNLGDIQVGARLNEEITRVFGSKTAAADAMGIAQGSYFSPYITGRNKIGGILQQRLLKSGIDLQYVLEGVRDQMRQSAQGDVVECSIELQRLKRRMDMITDELKDMAKVMDKLSRRNSL
ncbi:MAG: hypothetical protein HGB00_08300 [Chlorobiaceae bacterium]|nr:hypothetical protein [Chlorobiaceae bacterium]